jgi:hypothetical protein
MAFTIIQRSAKGADYRFFDCTFDADAADNSGTTLNDVGNLSFDYATIQPQNAAAALAQLFCVITRATPAESFNNVQVSKGNVPLSAGAAFRLVLHIRGGDAD